MQGHRCRQSLPNCRWKQWLQRNELWARCRGVDEAQTSDLWLEINLKCQQNFFLDSSNKSCQDTRPSHIFIHLHNLLDSFLCAQGNRVQNGAFLKRQKTERVLVLINGAVPGPNPDLHC